MMNPKLVRWLRKDRASKILGAFLLFVVAIVFLITRLSQDNVISKGDLKFIQGQLRDYKFADGSKGFHDYIIWLDGLSTPLQVSADFINLFKDKKFQQLQYGDTLVIGLSKEGFELVQKNTPKRVLVYSVRSETHTFLDSSAAIKKYNSPFIFYACAFFFLSGITLTYLLYQTKKNKVESKAVIVGNSIETNA